MLEITGDEISQLNDTDLRSLIGLLCEAELAFAQVSTAGVTWGGNQNAKDGGIDVRVDSESITENDGFIPRANTAFQVKKPDMPRSDILEEMRPTGELREVIKNLADKHGAYILISSQGSTSDSSLNNRKSAMREAIQGYPNASKLKIDFYDRGRVASWVRSHPSMVLWVREKIGCPLQGWQSFENWADSSEDKNSEYYIDGTSRLSDSSRTDTTVMDLLQGIQVMRAKLILPGSSVRLIGLSGVGKTRLIQALFDDRIGEGSLNKSLAFYTDMGNGPMPDPKSFLIRLKSIEKRGILIVDNCPPDLHSQLTKLNTSKSLISLITVEYDVREDQPEQTSVFRLEPSSNELLEKVISNKFCHINSITSKRIAEISGGNARVAIAIARTIEANESISQLRDAELFNRLFRQRHDSDSKLLQVAEICSLVYSFNVDIEEKNIEMTLLAELAGVSVLQLYQNVAELKRRDLVQQRSTWRAVLPHAVANRLAKNSLDNFPLSVLRDTFENRANKRLLLSFSRRIGYLQHNPRALEIAEKWLSAEGPLGDFLNLNNDSLTMLKNIAPIQPELVLSLMEKILDQDRDSTFFTRYNRNFTYYTNLLKSLAYNVNLFDRSVQLLCMFALSENPEENNNSIRSTLKSLFHLYLSGTHATVEQRLKIISKLIESDSDEKIQLGLSLLDASLEAWHFTTIGNFDFGAHIRDYGYQPETSDEIKYWYETFIHYAVSQCLKNQNLSTEIKAIFCRKFRGLWTRAKVYNALENAVKDIIVKDKWFEAWYIVKNTIRFDFDKMSKEHVAKLESLATLLEPQDLYDEVRLLTLPGHGNFLYFNNENAKNDSFVFIEELGIKVSSEEATLNELLRHLLSTNTRNTFALGQGLSKGTNNHTKLWYTMVQKLGSIESSKRDYQLLQGFLQYLASIDKPLTNKLLDESIEHEILSEVFPLVQIVILDIDGYKRIKRSIHLGKSPIYLYGNLAYTSSFEQKNEEPFIELIQLISTKEDQEGLMVAIRIFFMKTYHKNEEMSKKILTLGRELVLRYDFSQENRNILFEISEIVKICFQDIDAIHQTKLLVEKIYLVVANNHIFYTELHNIYDSLIEVHPFVFLDVFIADHMEINYYIKQIFSGQLTANPLNNIPHELFIEWCKNQKEAIYPLIASVIKPYIHVDNDHLQWTSVALFLIDNYSDPSVILEEFMGIFYPNQWEGSLADKMLKRLPLLDMLLPHEDPGISQWAENKQPILRKEIAEIVETERNREKNQNERFE
ncbi:hypothetical protein ACIOBL_10280 [Paenibacillus taichungensis]|uniref:hypothetical protein n=1 Tax=Paenibacillus taichungensis TaxID=484184 RepID=UPI003814991D